MARTPPPAVPIPLRISLPDSRLSRLVTPLVFLIVGIGVPIWFHRQAPWLEGWQRYLPYAMGGFLVLMGGVSIVRELRRGAAREAARKALEVHRDAPWRVRPEWRRSELTAVSNLDRSFVALAVFWNLFSWPLAYVLIRGEQGSGDGAVWLVALFPLVGLGLLGRVVFERGRIRKFGAATVVLEPLPARLGGSCGGTLRARVSRDALPEDGFRVVVSCYRQRVRHTRDSDGDRRRTIERDLLWRDETRLRGDPTVDGRGVEVPFGFELPDDAPPSTPLKLDERILWEVAADAEVPGIDFRARFEIPVFPPEPGTERRKAEAPPVQDPAARSFDRPLTEGIRLVDEPDLFELHFTAARKRKGAIVLGLLGVVLLGAGIPVFAASAGVGFMMLLIGAFLVYGAVQQGTNDTVLRVREDRVEVTHDGIGMPDDVDFPVDQVEEVLVHLGTNSASDDARYSISVVARAEEGLEHLRDQAGTVMNVMSRFGVAEGHPAMEAMRQGAEKPRIPVADALIDKDEADWLASRIREAVARARSAEPEEP